MQLKFSRFDSTKVRYLIVGIWNTLFSFAFFWILLFLLETRIGYLVVLTIAYPVTVIHAHFMQRRFVWLSNSAYRPELLRFVTMYVVLYVANLVLLYLAVDIQSLDPFWSQVTISLILIILSFLMNKRWTFQVSNT